MFCDAFAQATLANRLVSRIENYIVVALNIAHSFLYEKKKLLVHSEGQQNMQIDRTTVRDYRLSFCVCKLKLT